MNFENEFWKLTRCFFFFFFLSFSSLDSPEMLLLFLIWISSSLFLAIWWSWMSSQEAKNDWRRVRLSVVISNWDLSPLWKFQTKTFLTFTPVWYNKVQPVFLLIYPMWNGINWTGFLFNLLYITFTKQMSCCSIFDIKIVAQFDYVNEIGSPALRHFLS